MMNSKCLSILSVFAGSIALGWATCASAQDSRGQDGAKVAIALARDKLATELALDPAAIEVVSSEPKTWPNSSLGCGKPGTQSLQVVTSGHAVVLKSPKGTYRVHVSEKQAVLCEGTEWRNPRSVGLPLRNLNVKMDAARADLAAKLQVPAAEIRTQNFVATEWADTSMDCAIPGEAVIKQVTKGYRIALRYRGRVYTYHTDLDRVRPCPAIVAE
jgi:hypothetical protein